MRNFALGMLATVFLFTGYGAVADEKAEIEKVRKEGAERVKQLHDRITRSPSDFGALYAWRQWRIGNVMHRGSKEATGRVYDTGPGPGYFLLDWEQRLLFARTETAAKYCVAEIDKIERDLEEEGKKIEAGSAKQK